MAIQFSGLAIATFGLTGLTVSFAQPSLAQNQQPTLTSQQAHRFSYDLSHSSAADFFENRQRFEPEINLLLQQGFPGEKALEDNRQFDPATPSLLPSSKPQNLQQ